MIKSLQGLRALAMLGIFMFHAGLLIKGTFPVTFFFMLSGFVLYYSYSKKINEFKLRENIYWIKNRMKKLYPIHIITFIMSIFIRWEWIKKFDINELFIKVLLNITLLQSLSKQSIFIFNGLSWFLSTTFILYIIACPLILVIKNIRRIRVKYLIIVLLVIQNIIVIINIIYCYELNLYTSPFFRVFDFTLGMLVAKLFISTNKDNINSKKYSFYEFLAMIIFIFMYLLTLITNINFQYGLNYYSPLFIFLLYVFAMEKGMISKALSINILQKLAAFSFEFYMVHELILIFFRKVFFSLEYHWLVKNVIIAIPSFIISIILAIILNRYVTNRN